MSNLGHFDNIFGPGVTTHRHAATTASPWLSVPEHDGLWWVFDGRSTRVMSLRAIGNGRWLYATAGDACFGVVTESDGWLFAPVPAPPPLPEPDGVV